MEVGKQLFPNPQDLFVELVERWGVKVADFTFRAFICFKFRLLVFFFLMVICESEQVGYHTCLTDDFITFVFQICSLVVISFQVFQNVTEER